MINSIGANLTGHFIPSFYLYLPMTTRAGDLALIVLKRGNAIQWINLQPVDKHYQNLLVYAMYSDLLDG